MMTLITIVAYFRGGGGEYRPTYDQKKIIFTAKLKCFILYLYLKDTCITKNIEFK